MPTIFWLAHGDWFFRAASIAARPLATVLLLGILKGRLGTAAAGLSGTSCISLVRTAGQDFLSFQWDSLLLETGFLAIFLGNSKVVVSAVSMAAFPPDVSFGVVKLTSHDPVWRNWNRARVSLHDPAAANARSPGSCTSCRSDFSASPPLSRCSSNSRFRSFFALRRWRFVGRRYRVVLASSDFPYRQLHVFQFAHDVAVRSVLTIGRLRCLHCPARGSRTSAPPLWPCRHCHSGFESFRTPPDVLRGAFDTDNALVDLPERFKSRIPTAFRLHDHYAPRDHCRRIQRRRHLAALRIS